MRLEDIEVAGERRFLSKPAEVAALEKEYWVTMPEGYREYVTRLGEGVLGGTFVRIYPPARISREMEEWRARVKQYWLWDEGVKVMPKERGIECVIVGDTVGGDELIVHPGRPGKMYVLPRNSYKVFEIEGDLWAAVEWMCTSGKLTKRFTERKFEPFDTSKEAKSDSGGGMGSDPEGGSLEEIADVASRWAKRHKLVKLASAEVAKKLEVVTGGETKVRVGRQSLVFHPGSTGWKEFGVELELLDAETGFLVGTYHFSMSEDSRGGHFEPSLRRWNQWKERYAAAFGVGEGFGEML